jgi:hypothetical protein
VSINSFPDYKHVLQENYLEYKNSFLLLLQLVSKILCHVFIVMLQLHVCIPRSFIVINIYNQGKTLCSLCNIFHLFTWYIKPNRPSNLETKISDMKFSSLLKSHLLKKIESLILLFILRLVNNPESSKAPLGRELGVGVMPTIWAINLMCLP